MYTKWPWTSTVAASDQRGARVEAAGLPHRPPIWGTLQMAAPNAKLLCLYCGSPTKRGKKGEHIVPEAIDGALTLLDVSNRVVCSKCNSGVLSHLLHSLREPPVKQHD
jgi:hypothetical protein